MDDDEPVLVVTRDKVGTLLWEREPCFVHGGRFYFNGGNALPLSEDCFPELGTPGRTRVRLVPVEGES